MDSTLEDAKKVMLNILSEFDSFCRRHNLTYWLECGTLLGAVRHSGFIPWDDDIDIAMPRVDYNKFLEISHLLPKSLFVQNYMTDNFNEAYFTKIRDKKSNFILNMDKEVNYHQGLFIDIFPVDFISEKDIDKFIFLKKFIGLSYQNSIFNNLIKCPIIEIINFIGREKVINYFIQKYSCHNNNLSTFGVEMRIYRKFYISKDYIYPLCEIEFEGKNYFAPSNYDKYLTVMYGDYMKLPPESERVSPHSYQVVSTSNKKGS